MTGVAPRECKTCGRHGWDADQFCGACGTRLDTGPGREAESRQVTTLGPAAVHVHEIDPLAGPTSDRPTGATATTEPDRSQRGNLIGIGVLAMIIAALVAVFAIGGDDPDAVATPPIVEPTAQPAALLAAQSDTQQNSVPSAAPIVPTVVAPATPDASAIPPAPDQRAPTPEQRAPTLAESVPLRGPVLDPFDSAVTDITFEEQGRLLASLDMGSGWLVTVGGSNQAHAFNLETGEVITTLSNRIDQFGSILTPRGVYSPTDGQASQPTSAQFEQEWIFAPWSGDGETQVFDMPGLPIHAYIDDNAGPVAIVTTNGPGQIVDALYAVALESGEIKQIDIDVNIWLMQVGFRFAALLQRPGHGFLIEDGTKIHRWTWAEGWQELTSGRAISPSGDSVVVARCEGPQSCSFVLVGGNGDDIATLDDINHSLSILSNTVSVSPDLRLLAQAVNETTGTASSTIAIIDLADNSSVQVAVPGATWAMRWSPNGRFLLLFGTTGPVVLEVETGEITPIGFIGSGLGTPLMLFFDAVGDGA